jgi:Outer membrane lipoprotein-sorting protein
MLRVLRRGSRAALLTGAAIALSVVGSPPRPAAAGDAIAATKKGEIETPSRREVEEALPEGETLTGHDIYDRFLKNKKRLRTAYQEGRILSRDPAGNPQETRFWSHWKDYRDADDEAVGGVYSKTLLKISGPYELRHTGYLYIQRSDRPDEQFMYSPSRQRTTRVHIKGQNVVGTDFNVDDFLVTLDDIEDADYRRLPDEIVDGVPCYVVEATMKPSATTHYTRSISYVEKEHYVPLRTRYWDDVGVESKLLVSPRADIKEFDGCWVPTTATMTDLLEGTTSTLRIERLDPNPPLDDVAFAVTQLEFMP